MLALKIIGVILLIFLLLGFLRLGAIVSFGEELRVQLRLGALDRVAHTLTGDPFVFGDFGERKIVVVVIL